MSAQGSTAITALATVPIGRATATGAAPSLLLLCNPGVNADIPLPPDIGQHFTMVGKSIITEIDELLAGKVSTLITVCQSLLQRTGAEPTNATRKGDYL